eukprot:TRINITY_DN4098_c0_g1_i1.p1 TRINITY_DN4098_c0_g1~~TRINITY_DN4098_c0_g1_i1.p1  ORF type:complete len:235 (-),score=58.71 TRINITY_DN4098_c0_g1_i1:47-751(-)
MKPIILFLLIALAVIVSASAQSIFKLSQADKQAFIKTHNQARADVNPPAMPGFNKVTWDDSLQRAAENYFVNCKYNHSLMGYGENLAFSARVPTAWAEGMVNLWLREKQYYDYNTNSCQGGVCGHYTQAIWNTSVKIGCARIDGCSQWNHIVACEYSPPGNVIGRRPYAKSSAPLPSPSRSRSIAKSLSRSQSKPVDQCRQQCKKAFRKCKKDGGALPACKRNRRECFQACAQN